MATLTARQRRALPPSAFVFPGARRYPIQDRAHAVAALRFAAGTADEATVRSAVRKRWGIG